MIQGCVVYMAPNAEPDWIILYHMQNQCAAHEKIQDIVFQFLYLVCWNCFLCLHVVTMILYLLISGPFNFMMSHFDWKSWVWERMEWLTQATKNSRRIYVLVTREYPSKTINPLTCFLLFSAHCFDVIHDCIEHLKITLQLIVLVQCH